METLVAGVAGLNAVFAVVGFAVLATALRGARPHIWASYAGLAVLVGFASCGVALACEAAVGVHIGPVALAATAAALTLSGIGAAIAVPPRMRVRFAPVRPAPRPIGWLSLVGAYVLTAICAFGLTGGFRAAAWLDDTWNFWLPKGIVLDRIGLSPSLFTTNPHFVYFPRLDDPLVWSIVTNLDMRFVGRIDMRAIDAQLTILVVAFAGALARLLWGRVRPGALVAGLLLLVASPALLRQARGGGADLPLAISLAVFALGSFGWLLGGEAFALALAALGGAAAANMKSEGLPQLLLVAAVLTAVAVGVRVGKRRIGWFVVATAASVATYVPWWAWEAAHGVRNEASLSAALTPSYLGAHTSQLFGAAHQMLRVSMDVHEWLLIVPLAVALSATVAFRRRDVRWLAPLAVLVVDTAFWLWVFWADPWNRGAVFGAVYRTTDALVVLAAVSLPFLFDRLVEQGRPAGAITAAHGARGAN